ncbi:hypothetical protein ACP275_06G024700 [Erythranthe tilingii]
MEVDKGAKLKETEANEFVNNGVKPNTEYECCLSCLELQDIITEANEKFVLLELEIAKQNSVIESLNQRNKELEKILIDLKKRLSSVNVITKTSSFSSAENKTKSNQDEDPSGTSPINTLDNQCTNAEIFKKGRRRKLKNISPSTPGGSRPPFGPNEISDSDDNTPISIKRRKVRRGVPCVVSSESESESDDDNIPICRLISKKSFDECEGESLGGFIVSNASDGDDDESSENASESSAVYADVISSIRRERKDKTRWEYEGDMLADLAKSPKLCMKAVCALYRQQTLEEQSSQATIVRNGRGFSHFHSFMGSELAEFLTDGDTWGDVKKTEEELRQFNSYGIEHCTKMATHYSKQLFEIYENNEDSFFRPQDEV